jgi:hypothetical protein
MNENKTVNSCVLPNLSLFINVPQILYTKISPKRPPPPPPPKKSVPVLVDFSVKDGSTCQGYVRLWLVVLIFR